MIATGLNVWLALLAILLSTWRFFVALKKLIPREPSSPPIEAFTTASAPSSPQQRVKRFVSRFTEPRAKRSSSCPPERPTRRRRAEMLLSPNLKVNRRLKQRFGEHVAHALGESHSERIAQSYSADGLRLSREVSRQRLLLARPTLPKIRTDPAATGIPEEMLPSDERPWDRLHVWLVDGEGLPYRPKLWPFEPHVVVSTVGSEPGAAALLTDTFEFQTIPEFTSPTNPVWDERVRARHSSFSSLLVCFECFCLLTLSAFLSFYRASSATVAAAVHSASASS